MIGLKLLCSSLLLGLVLSDVEIIPQCYIGPENKQSLFQAVDDTNKKIHDAIVGDYEYHLIEAKSNVVFCPLYVQYETESSSLIDEETELPNGELCTRRGVPNNLNTNLEILLAEMQQPFLNAHAVCWTPTYYDDGYIDVQLEVYPSETDKSQDYYISILGIGPISEEDEQGSVDIEANQVQLNEPSYQDLNPTCYTEGIDQKKGQQDIEQFQWKWRAKNLKVYKYIYFESRGNITGCPVSVGVSHGTVIFANVDTTASGTAGQCVAFEKRFATPLENIIEYVKEAGKTAYAICMTPVQHPNGSFDIHLAVHPSRVDEAKDIFIDIIGISPLTV